MCFSTIPRHFFISSPVERRRCTSLSTWFYKCFRFTAWRYEFCHALVPPFLYFLISCMAPLATKKSTSTRLAVTLSCEPLTEKVLLELTEEKNQLESLMVFQLSFLQIRHPLRLGKCEKVLGRNYICLHLYFPMPSYSLSFLLSLSPFPRLPLFPTCCLLMSLQFPDRCTQFSSTFLDAATFPPCFPPCFPLYLLPPYLHLSILSLFPSTYTRCQAFQVHS